MYCQLQDSDGEEINNYRWYEEAKAVTISGNE